MYTKDEYANFFKEADTDGSGTLSLTEVKTMLEKYGYKIDLDKLALMFKVADTSDDGQISFDEYLSAMGDQTTYVHGSAPMRLVFLKFDKNGDGKIDRGELRTVFQSMGRDLTEDELTRAMTMCDDDGSGGIDYEEFLRHFFNVDI